MGIIAILMAFVAPAFTNLKSAADVTNAAYTIKGLLEQARTYAMANNTHVFLGFAEVDASVDASTTPQVTTGARPYGRVAIAAVASKDGTRHFEYSTSNQGADWQANYTDPSKPEYQGNHLTALMKLQRLENLHFLVDFPSWAPSSHPDSKMARYQPRGASTYTLGNSNSMSATPFSWPLGSPLSSGQYNFVKVIMFDPQGVARIATQTNADEIADIMEIDLQLCHGTSVPPVPTNQDVGDIVVIQIDPMSGELRLYRP